MIGPSVVLCLTTQIGIEIHVLVHFGLLHGLLCTGKFLTEMQGIFVMLVACAVGHRNMIYLYASLVQLRYVVCEYVAV